MRSAARCLDRRDTRLPASCVKGITRSQSRPARDPPSQTGLQSTGSRTTNPLAWDKRVSAETGSRIHKKLWNSLNNHTERLHCSRLQRVRKSY